MNFITTAIIVLIFITTNCFSQKKTFNDVTDIIKITLLDPGISFEKWIGKLQTLNFHVFYSVSAYFSYSSNLGTNSGVYADPALSLQYRYYYNASKRETKGKRTAMNSMNYLSPVLQTVFNNSAISTSQNKNYHPRAFTTAGVVWGVQRNYQKNFSLDVNFGLGYLFAKANYPKNGLLLPVYDAISQLTGIVQLNIGFWLNKKNK